MLVQNLQQRCIELAGINTTKDEDPLYKAFWTKWITAIDQEKTSGFAFIGDFFENGALQLDPAPRLILFAASTGLHHYPGYNERGKRIPKSFYEYHEIMLLTAEGELTRTGLQNYDSPEARERSSWVAALRDQTNLLLSRINQVYGSTTPLQIAFDHLSQRALAVRLGNPVTWTQADIDMLLILFNTVEKQTKPSGHAQPVQDTT